MIQHFNILVKGRVQGVFYRASTVDKARSLNINGTVKNLPDGSVMINAEGSIQQLDELVSWCKEGPPMANVTEVIVSKGEVKGYNKFEVVRA